MDWKFMIVWAVFFIAVTYLFIAFGGRMRRIKAEKQKAQMEYLERQKKYSYLKPGTLDECPREEVVAAALFHCMRKEDEDIVTWALQSTGIEEFRERPIEALSGGQRQRAWIAMAIAQQTEILILDEPTTYLDLAHQLEILKLLEELNKKQGTTIVMVIHELNNAARFADHMIGVKKGKVVCEGTAHEVMTKENLKELFNIDAEIVEDPRNNKPVCLTYDMLV